MAKVLSNIFLGLIKNLKAFKAGEVIFLIFIFCLPFSKHLEILSPYSFLDGKFLIYTTFTIYGFEFLLAASLLVWIVSILMGRIKSTIDNTSLLVLFVLFLVNSFVLSFSSVSPIISFYYLAVLLVGFFVVLFMENNFNKEKKLFVLKNIILVSALVQSLIAFFQFVFNQSLGLDILGESILGSDLPGVAKVMIGGSQHIRAYGTFSHPNLLAFFLSFSSIVGFSILNKKEKSSGAYNIFVVSSVFLILLAVFFTFSRIVLFLTLVFLGTLLFKSGVKRRLYSVYKKNKGRIILLIVLVFAALLIFGGKALLWRFDPFISTTWESLEIRNTLAYQTILMFKNNPMGVGLGNHIVVLAHYLVGYPIWMAEPVHNTYLLILSEAGFLGLALFLGFLFSIYRRADSVSIEVRMVFFFLLIYMAFDHFFWDIRNGQYMFFIILGLFLAESRASSNKG